MSHLSISVKTFILACLFFANFCSAQSIKFLNSTVPDTSSNNDNFGFSYAINGDTMLASAIDFEVPDTNPSAPVAGRVFEFRNINGDWVQQSFIDSPETITGVWWNMTFGGEIALTGDTAVIRSRVLFFDFQTYDYLSVFRRVNNTWQAAGLIESVDVTSVQNIDNYSLSRWRRSL